MYLKDDNEFYELTIIRTCSKLNCERKNYCFFLMTEKKKMNMMITLLCEDLEISKKNIEHITHAFCVFMKNIQPITDNIFNSKIKESDGIIKFEKPCRFLSLLNYTTLYYKS